ncbi:MAG TPA: pitrilysin family protein [Vicinamibacterales bacterium]|nr:pitrilysin family protein [Vicinamibacterales bacterium]
MKPADRSRLPDVGADPLFVFPSIVHHRLANGLAVRFVEHRSAPVVTFVLQVDGGAGADPAALHGLAAVSADMLDEGTGSMDALEVSDALARLGADYDLDVGPDATTISLTTLERFTGRAAALLAELVIRPALREADFDRVRQLRVDRLRQLKDVPAAMAERAFLQLVYGQHPYGHLTLGRLESLSAMVLPDVVSFHRSMYRPSRTTLVIAGPMSADEAFRVVESAFGEWAEPSSQPEVAASAASIDPPATPAARLAVVPREGAAQSELRIGHLCARRDTPDYFPLVVMNAIMGGQFVSRINLKLREEKGYTYGARTGLDWRLGLTPFVLQASVHSRATADAIRDSLAELADIRGARPPSDSELALAKASITRGYPRNFETVAQVARGAAQLALFRLPDSYFANFTQRVNEVSGEDVMRVAQHYLDMTRMVTLAVGDLAAIRDPLEALGLGAPQVVPVEV